MAQPTVSMKLLIDTRGKRVLFAEAGKDCVDFLFYILSLPVATVIRLLKEEPMVGSLPNLYKSLESLNDDYIEPGKKKESYLNPAAPGPTCPVPLLGPNTLFSFSSSSSSSGSGSSPSSCSGSGFGFGSRPSPSGSGFGSSPSPPLFGSSSNSNSNSKIDYGFHSSLSPPMFGSSSNSNSKIDYGFRSSPSPPMFGLSSSTRLEPESEPKSTAGEGGVVKGMVTYMVMDDLEIKPMSTISSITLLNKYNVKEVGDLKEKVVTLGMKQALKLLKASLQSQTVLTDVFCNC